MNFNTNILLLLLCILNNTFIYSQYKESDSLQLVLSSAKEDTNKVHTLINLCERRIKENNLEQAEKAAKQAIQLSENLKYDKGLANSYLKLVLVYSEQENYVETLRISYVALDFFKKVNDKKGGSKIFQIIGGTFLAQGNYIAAKENMLASLKVRQELGDSIELAQSYNSMGLLLSNESHIERQKYFFSALKIYKQSGERSPAWGLGWTYALIAHTYNGQADSASLAGNQNIRASKLLEALKYFILSLGAWEKANDKQGVIEQNIHLGNQYVRLNNFLMARSYLEKGLTLSQIFSFKKGFRDSFLALSNLESNQGNHKKALAHFKMFVLYRDSIHNEESRRESSELKMKYDFSKKEDSLKIKQVETQSKLESQQKQNTFYLVGTILLTLLFVLVLLNFRNQKRINKLLHTAHTKEKHKLELENQQTILNERLRISRELHDEVGATLSGIAMYSHLTKEQMKIGNQDEIVKSLNIMQQSSGEMVNKLNDIVWLINPEQDSLQKLIDRLEEYARNMAVIKNMSVNITVPQKINELTFPIESRRTIYLFCKEAINNAVKYSGGTFLELVITESTEGIEFSVNDNGKGFDAVMVRRGNGLENMQQRADEIGAKLTVQSKMNEGARVSMQYKIT